MYVCGLYLYIIIFYEKIGATWKHCSHAVFPIYGPHYLQLPAEMKNVQVYGFIRPILCVSEILLYIKYL